LHLSVTKFKGDVGFSLLQGDALTVDGETTMEIESPVKEGIPDEYLMASSLTPRQHRPPTLPEFKSVKELAEVYSAFTQANLKYRVLQRKERERLLQAQERLATLHDRRRLAKDQEAAILAELSRTEDEFKDDLIMIQLKITPKDHPHKKGNTLTFLNLPLAYSSDTNVVTLLDVIAKVKKENAK